jgi:hypothetical protein
MWTLISFEVIVKDIPTLKNNILQIINKEESDSENNKFEV